MRINFALPLFCTGHPCSHMIAFPPSQNRLLNCVNLPLPTLTYLLHISSDSLFSPPIPPRIYSVPLSCTPSLRDGLMLPAVALSWLYQLPCLLSSFLSFCVLCCAAVLLFCFPWLHAIASDHLPHFFFSFPPLLLPFSFPSDVSTTIYILFVVTG